MRLQTYVNGEAENYKEVEPLVVFGVKDVDF